MPRSFPSTGRSLSASGRVIVAGATASTEIIDDFESGDLSAWERTQNWSASTTEAYEGSYAAASSSDFDSLDMIGKAGEDTRFERSGENTPMEFYIRMDNVDEDFRFWFGLQSSSNFDDGYQLVIQDNSLVFQRYEAGSVTDTSGGMDPLLSANTWYKVAVFFGYNGNADVIRAEINDGDVAHHNYDTSVNTVTYDSGWWGFARSSGGTGTIYIDRVQQTTYSGDTGDDVGNVYYDYKDVSDPSNIYYTNQGNWFKQTDFGYDDQHSIYGEILAGNHYGGSCVYDYPDNGHGQPAEKYERAYIYIDDNWAMDDGHSCKVWWCGWNAEAGPAGNGGDGPPSGDDGWSERLFLKHYAGNAEDTFECEQYSYHMDQSSNYGDEIAWGRSLTAGQWYQFDNYVKMNTVSGGSANADGIIRCWIDGSLEFEATDRRWTTTTDQAIEYSGAGIYYGGPETPPGDLYLNVDNHEINIDGGESL